MSRQAEKIYEVLISDDPEGELEKYYDVAPIIKTSKINKMDISNVFCLVIIMIIMVSGTIIKKVLVKIDAACFHKGASLYLKNLNNITQEMQLEILKRDKLDYVFQSLSVIAIVPMLFLEPIKKVTTQEQGCNKSHNRQCNAVDIEPFYLIFRCCIF